MRCGSLGLAHDPALVLLDEPTDGLDPVQRDDMLELIHRIGTEYGIDVVLSSHLLEEVERICDNVIILSDGRVVRSGSIAEMRGSRTGVVIELDGGQETVADALRQQGLAVKVDGRRLLVDAPPQPGADECPSRTSSWSRTRPLRGVCPACRNLKILRLKTPRHKVLLASSPRLG